MQVMELVQILLFKEDFFVQGCNCLLQNFRLNHRIIFRFLVVRRRVSNKPDPSACILAYAGLFARARFAPAVLLTS